MDALLETPPDHTTNFRQRLVAPLMTLGIIGIIELLQLLFHATPPSPSPVFLLVLACGAFISGLRAGMVSALIALAYLAFFFQGADGPWLKKFTIVNLSRMLLLCVVAPSIVLIIGLLKRRLLASERANAANLRRETEELLRLATETVGIGIFSRDADENSRMTVSAQCRKNYGLPPDGTLDFSTLVNELIIPADRERTKEIIRTALAPGGSGLYDLEYRIRRPNDGMERWLSVRARALPASGGKRTIVGAAIDITDRKEAERGMVLLKAAVESANDGVVITEALLNPPGPRIEYANPAFSRMTGYSFEELVGKTPRILQGPRTDKALLHRLHESLEKGGAFHAETVNYRKDGQPYYVEWRITAVRDETGETTQWVAIQRDVTERVQAEQERERLLEAERRTSQELERAGRIKDEFLATLSHELRTPLNAIMGWVHILKTDGPNAEIQGAALEVIERNSRVQLQLIEDLLDVSRIINGKMRLKTSAVSLADVAGAALETVRPSARAREIRLESSFDPAMGPVTGDPDRLQQVVWNLLSNAVKFTPKGGQVNVRLASEGAAAKIVVSDNGPGIPEEFLPHIFERFRQADSSSTRAHSGLGIGLALVRHLVELHGGTVEAANGANGASGQGAIFTVTLPMPVVSRAEANNGKHPSPSVAGELPGVEVLAVTSKPAGVLGGMRVLAVDDDADTRELLTAILSAHGASVTAVVNVADGMEVMRRERPGVLICDIEMPAEDGYGMIGRVRRLAAAEGGAIPAIALTAYARKDDERRALATGFQRHMAKPVNPDELVITLAGLVGRSVDVAALRR